MACRGLTSVAGMGFLIRSWWVGGAARSGDAAEPVPQNARDFPVRAGWAGRPAHPPRTTAVIRDDRGSRYARVPYLIQQDEREVHGPTWLTVQVLSGARGPGGRGAHSEPPGGTGWPGKQGRSCLRMAFGVARWATPVRVLGPPRPPGSPREVPRSGTGSAAPPGRPAPAPRTRPGQEPRMSIQPKTNPAGMACAIKRRKPSPVRCGRAPGRRQPRHTSS